MKHRDYQEMMDNPLTVQPEDIAQYAVMNSDENDRNKYQQICDLIATSNAAYNFAITHSKMKDSEIANLRFIHLNTLDNK